MYMFRTFDQRKKELIKDILPLFAVGVFIQRRDYLFGAQTSNVIEAILNDLSTLKVQPIVDLVLSTS